MIKVKCKMKKNMMLESFRAELIKLDETEIEIDYVYKKPVFFRKLLGLCTINVNHFSFERAVRFTDIDGNLPSFRSALSYPGILIKYSIQKLTKKYVVKNPKPFLVTDAVDYIEKTITDDCKVLEVGAGNSTLWFLRHGCKVKSIEHNSSWAKDIEENAKKITNGTSAELDLKVFEGEEALEYMSKIDQKFDIILIDSMNFYTSRYESIKILKEKLTADGILVLDNSDGVVNWKAVSEMDGVKSEVFTGYAFNCPFVCQTTVWHASDI